jgi:hypothetical protein
MDAYINETLISNHHWYVGLVKEGWEEGDGLPNGDATVLKQKEVLFGGDPAAPPIPVSFFYKVNGGAEQPAQWSMGSGASWGWWVQGRLNAGQAFTADTIQWRIHIAPQEYQNMGRYMLDPVIVAVPEL